VTLVLDLLRDLLHFLMIINAGAGILIWAMGVRQSLLMVSNAPEWRGWLTLRRPLASELPEAYLRHRRQGIRLMFAFFAIIAIEAFLALLNTLFFRAAN
jgi:hypothetical protein